MGSKMKKYIFALNSLRFQRKIGNKAAGLKFLIRHGYRVPRTFVCIWDAYALHAEGDHSVLESIREQLIKAIDINKYHAVRSSANIEDEVSRSFAGQFRTVLQVRGINNIIDAIVSVWNSASRPADPSYTGEGKSAPPPLKMAVLIQEMVNPLISGVSFSKNPMTGHSEVIIEAVTGSGERLLQAGETPLRWVNKWGTWINKPHDGPIPPELMDEVVSYTREIEKKYGRAADLEWVFDGKDLCFVQVRGIIFHDISIYSNRISREVLPGIIKPLVWSVNVPVVNGAWTRILKRLTGIREIEPDSLSRQFYYRAYFDMKVFGQIFDLFGFPRETLEILMGVEIEGPERPKFRPGPRSLLMMPRIMLFAASLIGIERRFKRFEKKMKSEFSRIYRKDMQNMDETQLFEEINKISAMSSITAHYNIVLPILAMVFNRLMQRILQGLGIDYSNIQPGYSRKELLEYCPHLHLERLNKIYKAEKEKDSLRFINEMDDFIKRFGHFSDSGNDFSVPPWRENPDLVKKMIIDFREGRSSKNGSKCFDELGLRGMKRLAARYVYNLAGRLSVDREKVSSLYTYGYGQFRNYFMALAKILVKKNKIGETEDIFYLYIDEVQKLAGGKKQEKWKRLIKGRKEEIDKARDFKIPDIIYGDQALPADIDLSRNMKGIPTSHGLYTGPAKVLKGLDEMDKINGGDVLVIPYSDVGWAPLFSKAGAVISESGGILSHSSILAREYKIPAVLSVTGACSIPDHTLVTVDGFKGEIYIREKQKPGKG